MLSLFALLAVAAAVPHNLLPRALINHVNYPVQSCSGVPEANYFSCEDSASVSAKSCCYEQYGVIIQTQFWDYDTSYNKRETPRTDKRDTSDVFTIHGLWNDLCDGSYKQYCDSSLEFADSDNLEDIIANQFNRQDLYDAMSTYWLSNSGSDASLWEHEYNKHGTCFNTLHPECFTGTYTRFENAIAFFQKVVEVWSGLPSYDLLQQAGITPSADQQYLLLDVQAALAAGHLGKEVYVGCTSGAINEVWYFHHVKGNAITGEYEAVDSLTLSDCPDSVWYYPK